MSSTNQAAVHREILGIPYDRCQPGTRILRVTVVRGSSLMKKDIFGTSDPYCRVSLFRDVRQTVCIGSSVRTKTLKRTLNPLWNEEFFFRVNPESNRLLFEVFDENRITRDDFLGLVVIHLPQLDIRTEGSDNTRSSAKSFLLRQRSVRSRVQGKLMLALSYLPANVDLQLSQVPERSSISPNTLHDLALCAAKIPSSVAADLSALNSEPSPSLMANSEANLGDNCSIAARNSPILDNDPLPVGWDERVDQNGRTYYVDHTNRRTQWDRPLSRLPDKWEQRTDINGRVYYVDHVNHRTTWYNPIFSENDFSANISKMPAGLHSAEQESSLVDVSGAFPSLDNANYADANPPLSAVAYPSNSPDTIAGARLESEETNKFLCGNSGLLTSATMRPSRLHAPGRTPEEEVQAAQTMYLRRHQIRAEDTAPCNMYDAPVEEAPDQSRTLTTDSSSVEMIDSSHFNHMNTFDNVPDDSKYTVPDNRDGISNLDSLILPHSQSVLSSPPSNSKPAPRREISIVSSPSNHDGGASLPPGWQMGLTASGRSFFINHNDQTTTWEDPRQRSSSIVENIRDSPSVLMQDMKKHSIPALGPLPPGWEERIHTNGRIFYINHNARATQWEDPRLQSLGGPAVPYSRNYRQKYDYFRSRLRAPRDVQAKFEIRVTRQGIFEDSFRLIYSVKKPEVLMHRLWIEFLGEKGLDYGGVQREWFFLLSREMFNPYYGLFEYSAADNYTLQINPLSGLANDDHLRYFKFIGRVCGMAVYHGKLVDGFFIRPFYKMMLGKKITLKDMEAVDSEYYRSLKYILDADPRDLDLTFSVDEEHFGETVEVDLVPNGRSISVTNSNKREYIENIINWRFVSRVQNQMCAFLEGFNDLIPLETLQLFDANELELLMCGLQDINVHDWKANTLYKGDYNENHPVIVNFWKALYTFTNELRSRLLQFVTGTSRVPMNGFIELWGSTGPQHFSIESWGTIDQLPRAHTCFNRLDLPPYPTFEDLRCKLIIAIENAEGFEGVD